MNKRIISGEISLEPAIQLMSEEGYRSKTSQVKVSELSEEVPGRAWIARSRQRADEYNRNRQRKSKDERSLGAR